MISFMESLAELWWGWMAPMSFQFSILTAILWLVERCLRRWSRADACSAVWCVALVKLVVPPTLVSLFPLMNWLPREPGLATQSLTVSGGSGLFVVLFSVWMIGAGLFGAIAIRRHRAARRKWLSGAVSDPKAQISQAIRNAAENIKLARIPEVLFQQADVIPAVVGFIRPIVVLPHSLRNEPTRFRHVLLHEFAHLKRRDPLFALAAIVIQAIYWFHPLVWWLVRRLGDLREVCCDAMVSEVLNGATRAYQRTLVQFAGIPLNRLSAGQLGLFERRSRLLLRLRTLEEGRAPRTPTRRLLIAMLVVVLGICFVPQALPRVPGLREVASLDDLPGCLHRRYLVFGMLRSDETTHLARASGGYD